MKTTLFILLLGIAAGTCTEASAGPLEATVATHDKVIEMLLEANTNLQFRVKALEATVADLLSRHSDAPTTDGPLHHNRMLTSYPPSELSTATRIYKSGIETWMLNVTGDIHIGGSLYSRGRLWDPNWVPTLHPTPVPTPEPTPEPTPGPTARVWNLVYHLSTDGGPSFNGYTCKTTGVPKPSDADLTSSSKTNWCLGLNTYPVSTRTVYRLGCTGAGTARTNVMYVRGITDIANAFTAGGSMSSYDQLECSYYEDFQDSVTGCACLGYEGSVHTYWNILERPEGEACFASGGGAYNAWPARVGPSGDAINYAFFNAGTPYALRHCAAIAFNSVPGVGSLHFADASIMVP
jgi:hypothetical protein